MTDLIFALAEIFIVTSYLFRNILTLRLITILGMTGYVIGGVYAGYSEAGMKSLIFFSSLGILVNTIQVLRLLADKSTIFLSDDIKEIYKNMFTSMSVSDFLKLYKLSQRRLYTQGEILAEQDKPISNLMVISKGSASIVKDGEYIVAKLGTGYFIGEMSFLTDNLATATVKSENDLECITWEKEKLKKLRKTNPKLYEKLQLDISINLVKKINQLKPQQQHETNNE